MRAFALILIAFLPVCVFAYTSVIAHPQSASVVLPIAHPESAQEFFGKLDGFPHTFEFALSEAVHFRASVLAHDAALQKNDVSILVVRQEQRGVAEIGRTDIKDATWSTVRDTHLAESFRTGGKVEAMLEPGSYLLEVSAPNNDAAYRLTIGENVDRSYFEDLQVLFEVKQLLHGSLWGAFLSPLLYAPLGLLMCLCVGVFIYRKNRRRDGTA